MPLIQYPDELQRNLSTAKSEFEAIRQRVRSATELLLHGKDSLEDLPSLLSEAPRVFDVFLSEIAARAAWLNEVDIISLLSWIDLSPEHPGKVELLRSILWDELHAIVGSIAESLQAAAGFPGALSNLESCYASNMQQARPAPVLGSELPDIAAPRGEHPLTRPIRVLIVDDINEIRDSLRKLLQFESDIDVVGEAENGLQAIGLCRKLHPDVVSMDIAMPKMDGITATKAICLEDHEARVVILSVLNDADTRQRATLAGACDFVSKPFNADEYIAKIRRVAQLRQPTQE